MFGSTKNDSCLPQKTQNSTDAESIQRLNCMSVNTHKTSPLGVLIAAIELTESSEELRFVREHAQTRDNSSHTGDTMHDEHTYVNTQKCEHTKSNAKLKRKRHEHTHKEHISDVPLKKRKIYDDSKATKSDVHMTNAYSHEPLLHSDTGTQTTLSFTPTTQLTIVEDDREQPSTSTQGDTLYGVKLLSHARTNECDSHSVSTTDSAQLSIAHNAMPPIQTRKKTRPKRSEELAEYFKLINAHITLCHDAFLDEASVGILTTQAKQACIEKISYNGIHLFEYMTVAPSIFTSNIPHTVAQQDFNMFYSATQDIQNRLNTLRCTLLVEVDRLVTSNLSRMIYSRFADAINQIDMVYTSHAHKDKQKHEHANRLAKIAATSNIFLTQSNAHGLQDYINKTYGPDVCEVQSLDCLAYLNKISQRVDDNIIKIISNILNMHKYSSNALFLSKDQVINALASVCRLVSDAQFISLMEIIHTYPKVFIQNVTFIKQEYERRMADYNYYIPLEDRINRITDINMYAKIRDKLPFLDGIELRKRYIAAVLTKVTKDKVGQLRVTHNKESRLRYNGLYGSAIEALNVCLRSLNKCSQNSANDTMYKCFHEYLLNYERAKKAMVSIYPGVAKDIDLRDRYNTVFVNLQAATFLAVEQIMLRSFQRTKRISIYVTQNILDSILFMVYAISERLGAHRLAQLKIGAILNTFTEEFTGRVYAVLEYSQQCGIAGLSSASCFDLTTDQKDRVAKHMQNIKTKQDESTEILHITVYCSMCSRNIRHKESTCIYSKLVHIALEVLMHQADMGINVRELASMLTGIYKDKFMHSLPFYLATQNVRYTAPDVITTLEDIIASYCYIAHNTHI